MTKFYDHTTYPSAGASGSSEAMRAELDLIETGFDNVELLKANKADVDFATNTHAATAKNPPIDTDELALLDSASSYILKKLTIAALKTALLASPIAIGNVAANTGKFTTLETTGNVGVGVAPVTQYGLNFTPTLSGSAVQEGINLQPTFSSAVSSLAVGIYSKLTTATAVHTINELENYRAQVPILGAGTIVTNHIAYEVGSGWDGITATNTYGFRSSITAGAGKYSLYMNGSANNYLAGNLGIGATPSGTILANLGGSFNGSTSLDLRGIDVQFSSPSSNTGVARGIIIEPNVSSGSTLANLEYFNAYQGSFIGATVTAQSGFTASATLIGATINYGFAGLIPAGTGRYNLYMAGSADNYLAGNLGIGTSPVGSTNLNLSPSTTSKSSLRLPHGVAPSSPSDGDVWSTTSGLFIRINGVTKTVNLT